MSKGILKTASGTILKNSSPAAIEEYLVGVMKDALGPWKSSVKIKPFLRIDEEDSDLTNNVKNAFGAIGLNAYGVNLYIPFIIADKVLLPFDTIRMGDQEIHYDYSKLRRVINAIEHKAKESEGENENGSGDGFKTMEVAKYEDIQPNNGFLGTIMNIRDSHSAKDMRNADAYTGPGFGQMDEGRIIKNAATDDVFDSFHEVMEKVAAVKVFTPSELRSFEEHLLKKAQNEENEKFEKVAVPDETLEGNKLKRDMMKLDEEKLFNVHRAASGNNIAFPTFEENRLEFRTGRVYRQFESWYKGSQSSSGKMAALVLDNKGGYAFLKANQPFMASTKEPDAVELLTTQAKSMKPNRMYALEKDETTLYNPFIVENSYVNERLNDGMVISRRELAGDFIGSRTSNSLFVDIFRCKEVFPGRENASSPSFYYKHFHIILTKDPHILAPKQLSAEDVRAYITQQALDPVDAGLATDMLPYGDDIILLPATFPLFDLNRNITAYYTKADGLFKEGPLAKTAAYEGNNKATLILEKSRKPKSYTIEWSFVRNEQAKPGVNATKIENRKVSNLSPDRAKAMLGKLGFDYRTQDKFFQIVQRNGRSATFRLPDAHKAAQASPPDSANSKVTQKMKGVADSMLHSRNFTPLFSDVLAEGATQALATMVPGTVGVAHNIGDFMGWKQAQETALDMEKLATSFNGGHWHEVSALLNMKYRLDKLAQEIHNGNFLYKGQEVFEKVAELKPVIEKKARELVDFNRQQLMNTDSYLVKPALIKEALRQMDGLTVYASYDSKKKERLTKLAGLFNSQAKSELKSLDQYVAKAEKKVKSLTRDFENKNAWLRASIKGEKDEETVQRAVKDIEEAQSQLNAGVDYLSQAYRERANKHQEVANKNLGIASAIGIPGIAGASYLSADLKDSND